MPAIKILVIPGSLRAGSFNAGLAAVAAKDSCIPAVNSDSGETRRTMKAAMPTLRSVRPSLSSSQAARTSIAISQARTALTDMPDRSR